MPDVPFSSADLEKLRPPDQRNPVWLRALGAIAVLATVLTLCSALVFVVQASNEKSEVIAAQTELIETVRDQLSVFTQTDDCLAAFSREITETQSHYLTVGLGGVLLSITTPEEDGDAAVAEFKRTLAEAQAAVQARDAYVAAGAELPCPIPTA